MGVSSCPDFAGIDLPRRETSPSSLQWTWSRSMSLRALVRTIDLAKAGIDEAVAKCRAAYVPWSVIGASLGISRQAAQQRFGKVEVS